MKMSSFFLWMILSLICLKVRSQSPTNDLNTAIQVVDAEQMSFRNFISTASFHPAVKKSLQKFAINDVISLQNNLQFLATVPMEKRVKAIRSLSYFMKELEGQYENKKINQHLIPGIIKEYKQTLAGLLSLNDTEVVQQQLENVSWRECQFFANTFWELDERKQIADISSYKRIIETPEYVFSFLENRPGFYYTDSLIIFMTKNYPGLLISYLQKNNNEVTAYARQQKNIYVQQLISFSSNSLASELAPFTEQIVNNELTIDNVLEKRKKTTEYFQLLVDKLMEDEQSKDEGDEPEFEMALLNAISEKSLDFYVKKINEQHDLPDAVRFQSLQSLRPQDLYYIIVSADEEMYTSTYLGLYKRLLNCFKAQSANSVLTLVHMDKFRTFVRIAATYNTLTDFLKHMPSGNSHELIHLFVSDIENEDEDIMVSNASDIADAFIAFSKDPALNAVMSEELNNALKKSEQQSRYQTARLYSILKEVYEIVNNNLSSDLSSDYNGLDFSLLKDKEVVSELALFYGDEDGKNSYNSFMNLFKDKTKWNININDSWATISSLQGQPIKIYANLPLSDDDEKDIGAQQALISYLQAQSIEPSILIHRGHSYHLANTLKYLNTSVRLAILGSCGGYKNINKIIDIDPDVHIIASKQVGSMVVNDPLLHQLNNELLQGKNIDWIVFWSKLNETFKNDANASRLFEEYIPPYKNVSSYVIKLYKYQDDETISSR